MPWGQLALHTPECCNWRLAQVTKIRSQISFPPRRCSRSNALAAGVCIDANFGATTCVFCVPQLARDCSLITKQCTPTDIDLFFTKVKDKKERRITFREFEDALKLIAEKKGKSVEQVLWRAACSHHGPVPTSSCFYCSICTHVHPEEDCQRPPPPPPPTALPHPWVYPIPPTLCFHGSHHH